MIGIAALFRRKPANAGLNEARPKDEPQPDPGRPRVRLAGGACDKTQDLIVCHDGERIGFRIPVDG